MLRELPEKRRIMVVLDKASVKTNIKSLQNARNDMEKDGLTVSPSSLSAQFYLVGQVGLFCLSVYVFVALLCGRME